MAQETVHLEVQTSGGDAQWQTVGPVTLLDDEGAVERDATAARNAQDSSSASTNTRGNQDHQKQLPKSVKKWLLSNFPKEQRKKIYLCRHAPSGGPNTNLLILLHGAGDVHNKYHELGRTTALPQTATLAWHAKGFVQLPFGLGYTWFQEMDYNTGQELQPKNETRIVSLRQAVTQVMHLLRLLMDDANGWIAERIFLLGYGAGATLAMATCQELYQQDKPALGGAVCICGGGGYQTSKNNSNHTNSTPILLMVGSNNTSFSPIMAQQAQLEYKQTCGGDAQVHVEPNKGQGMISTRGEMKAMMEFLAPKLVMSTQMPLPNAP